jgi:hypothetical protein
MPAFPSTGTRHNVEIYRRSGFRVVDEAGAPGGGPRIGSCAEIRAIALARLTTDHAAVNPQGTHAPADYLTK